MMPVSSDPADDQAAPALDMAGQLAALVPIWGALLSAAANAAKVFLDTLARARRAQAASVLGQAQIIADRIAARANKSNGLATPGHT